MDNEALSDFIRDQVCCPRPQGCELNGSEDCPAERVRAALITAARRPAQAERDGWVLVPREPTKAMIEAGSEARASFHSFEVNTRETYRAMLSAAPKEPE